MFSEKESLARKTYTEFISKKESDEIEKFYSKKNLPSILGDEDFKEWIKDKFRGLRFHREIPESRNLAFDSAKIRKIVCDVFGIEAEVLQQSRRGRENQARDVAIYLQRKYCGQTLAELGQDYGIPNYSTVSSACKRVKKRLSRDRNLLATIREIEKNFE